MFQRTRGTEVTSVESTQEKTRSKSYLKYELLILHNHIVICSFKLIHVIKFSPRCHLSSGVCFLLLSELRNPQNLWRWSMTHDLLSTKQRAVESSRLPINWYRLDLISTSIYINPYETYTPWCNHVTWEMARPPAHHPETETCHAWNPGIKGRSCSNSGVSRKRHLPAAPRHMEPQQPPKFPRDRVKKLQHHATGSSKRSTYMPSKDKFNWIYNMNLVL